MRKKKPVVDEHAERRAEILKTVREAVNALALKKTLDLSRSSPEISAAQDRLDDAMCAFVEGSASREDVKKAYKGFIDLQIVEKGTT